ncbi:hypothetical protein OS493_016768 [Desmophyllum pertusum]|uniref:Uncharacterized protein n=1 Tax=Desmophyllum pertusum TaxID=174260 RepID=A0A9W9Z0M1_9CNID|nr:hypothetical protein OS493_016768 [Desmophyllum pertusum]
MLRIPLSCVLDIHAIGVLHTRVIHQLMDTVAMPTLLSVAPRQILSPIVVTDIHLLLQKPVPSLFMGKHDRADPEDLGHEQCFRTCSGKDLRSVFRCRST